MRFEVKATKPCDCDNGKRWTDDASVPGKAVFDVEPCPDCVNGRVPVQEPYEVEGIKRARGSALIEFNAAFALPESGGTIELPDGVIISVEAVKE